MFLNEEFVLLNSEDPHKTYKEIILPKKLDIYEDYIQNLSMGNDLRIIFHTFSLLIFNHHFSKNKAKALNKDNLPSTAYPSHIIKPS